jgi:hypothetical protein
MYSIKDDNYREFHFLSTCYGEGITDEKVYTLFMIKVISELQPPISIAISNLCKHILKKYGVEIPPTFVKDILSNISKANKEIVFKKDNLYLKYMPESIVNSTKEQQEKLDLDSTLIFEEFKYHLYISKNVNLTFNEFNGAFAIYCKLILKQEFVHTNVSSIMTEWIYMVYRKRKNIDLIKALDRMIYSWLLYTYYYSFKRMRKKLYGFQIVFDTNVIGYLLNINGTERKQYVEYLLDKMKANNCSVLINNFTIKELKNLLNAEDILLIKYFKNEYPEVVKQLRLNPEEYLKSLFHHYGINTNIRQIKDINPNEKKYNDLIIDLRKYKLLKKATISDYSILHDIMLVNSFGNIHKINNIYTEKKLIGTCDNALYNWFSKYMKREYDSDFSHLLLLEKLNLIFWIESDKANSSEFLSNTWMYVTEMLGYFKNNTVDEYFKKIYERYCQNPYIPDNWRSLYILIENVVEGNIEDIDEDGFEKALDAINVNAINENIKLKDEITYLETELIKVKNEKNKVIEVEREISTHEEDKHKAIDEHSIFELIKLIIKRIINYFRKP